MHDPHESWPVFKSILANLCDKHIPKRIGKYKFQPPWFDIDCEKIFLEKEKGQGKVTYTGTKEENHGRKKCDLM